MGRYYFYTEGFSKAVKTKRVIELNTGLREVAKKIKVSAATISRIENGSVPEIDTFLKICHWLERIPREFIQTKPFMQFTEYDLPQTPKSKKP